MDSSVLGIVVVIAALGAGAFFYLQARRKKHTGVAPPPATVSPVSLPPQVGVPPAVATTPVPQPATVADWQTSGEPNDPGFRPLPARTHPLSGHPLPAEPYGAAPNGVPFTSMHERAAYFRALAARDQNLDDWQKQEAWQFFSGPVPIADITHEEANFLLYAQSNFGALPQGVFYAVASGPKADIDRLIGWADTHRDATAAAAYQGRMRGLVDDFANGRLVVKYGV